MNVFSFHSPAEDPKDNATELVHVPIHETQHYANEGSEFLDDAIRTRDQPLVHTEESIAAGCPQDLL